MNLYLVSQKVNNGYDTYDSFVCAAKDEEQARYVSPSSYYTWLDDCWCFVYADGTTKPSKFDAWCHPEDVSVKLIGDTSDQYSEPVIVLSSFNAG